MKKRITCFLCLVLIVSGGCQAREEMEMNQDLVIQFQKLMDEDVAGDKRSVEWDGIAAKVAEDKLDDFNIQDGRETFRVADVIEKKQWSISLPEWEKTETISDEEDHYCLNGKDCQLEIQRIEFLKEKETLDQDENMQDISEEKLSANIKNKNKEAVLYRGLKTIESQTMAGYSLVMEDYFGNAYRLDYFGIGNMTEIKIMADFLFGNFKIDFDFE